MKILKEYKINSGAIRDTLIVYTPENDKETGDIYNFRYTRYLEKGYIKENADLMDKDIYDKDESTFHIAIFSKRRKKILGYIRIIRAQPLPILRDCFSFREPYFRKFFREHKVIELSRMIVIKYSKNLSLPRHLLSFLLLDEVLTFCGENKIGFCYAFVKKKLMSKLKNILFPFFRIRNYRMIYRKGDVLWPYFNQHENPPLPIYFLVSPAITYKKIFFSLFFKKYIE